MFSVRDTSHHSDPFRDEAPRDLRWIALALFFCATIWGGAVFFFVKAFIRLTS